MPIYLFSNPKDESEVVEVIQSIKDDHVYIKDGIKWNRVFTVPNASIDTKWDSDNPRDFIEKTGKRRGTIGDMMEKSKELSERRNKRYGKDHVKEKFYDNYRKTHRGKDHPEKRKQKLKEKLEQTNFYWED